MANEVIEFRLELHKNYGASFGPRFSTAISTQSDGKEYRRPMWDQPLLYASVGDRLVDADDLAYLLEFHDQTMGSYRGFRLRDWTDYKVTQPQSGLWGNGAGASQMLKVYSFGGINTLRPLSKIVPGTTKLFSNGVEQGSPAMPAGDGIEYHGSWNVDVNNGLIYPGALGGTLSFTCEFDVPARFEQDKIDFSFEGRQGGVKVFRMAPLNCTEVRRYHATPGDLQALPAHISAEVVLGYDYGTLGGPAFSTKTVTTASEFEDRKFFWSVPKRSWDIGDRRCSKDDVDHLLNLFRVVRGRAVSFLYYDHQIDTGKSVRFAEDRISFRLEAIDETSGQAIYNLGGIALMEVFSGF